MRRLFLVSLCLLLATTVLAQYPGNEDLNEYVVGTRSLSTEQIQKCTPSALNQNGYLACTHWHTSNFAETARDVQTLLPCESRWYHTGVERAGGANSPRWGYVELRVRKSDNQGPNDSTEYLPDDNADDTFRIAVWMTDSSTEPPFSSFAAWGDWPVEPIVDTWTAHLCANLLKNYFDGLNRNTDDYYCRTDVDLCKLEPKNKAYWVLVNRRDEGTTGEGAVNFDLSVRVHNLEIVDLPYNNAAGTGFLRLEARQSLPFDCDCGFPRRNCGSNDCPGAGQSGTVFTPSDVYPIPGFLPAYTHHFRLSEAISFDGHTADGRDLRTRLLGAQLHIRVDNFADHETSVQSTTPQQGYSLAIRRGGFAMAEIDTDINFSSDFYIAAVQLFEIEGCHVDINSVASNRALDTSVETCANCGTTCTPDCTTQTDGDWYISIGLPSVTGDSQGQLFDFNISVSWENTQDLRVVESFVPLVDDHLGTLIYRVDRRVANEEFHFYAITPTVEPPAPGGFVDYRGTSMVVTVRGVAGDGWVEAHLSEKNYFPVDYVNGCGDSLEYAVCTPLDVCSMAVYPCEFELGATWYLTVFKAEGDIFSEYAVEIKLIPEVVSEVTNLQLLTNHPPFADGSVIHQGPYVAYDVVHEYQYRHYTLTLTPEDILDPTAYLAFEIFVDHEEDEVTVFINDVIPGRTPHLAGHGLRRLPFDTDHPIHHFDNGDCHDQCYENLPQWTCRTNEQTDHSGRPDGFDPQEQRVGFCHYKIEQCQLQARQYYFSVYGESKQQVDGDGRPLAPGGHENSYDLGVKFTATWYMGNATELAVRHTVNSAVHVPWANRPLVYSNQNFERVHYFFDVHDFEEDTVEVRVRIADLQNGVVEAFMAYNCMAGPCPCYHTHAHCTEADFFESTPGQASAHFCDLRLPFCQFGAGRYWVSVVGATASTPDHEATEPARSTSFTVTPYIEAAPAISFIEIDDFGVPAVISDTLAENELHHYRLDYDSVVDTDLLRIELKWVHEHQSTNIQDVMARLNRGTPATDDCVMYSCTATQNTQSDVSLADNIDNTYSYCVIELRPCHFVSGNWYLTVENHYDDETVTTNERIDYTLTVEVDERAVTELTLGNPIKSFVREASYAHFVIAYERRASTESSLVAQLYVNRDIRQDILFFVNMGDFAGWETDCYGSILLPCQTRYTLLAFDTGLPLFHEQRETCSAEIKACDIPVGRTLFYYSVLPDHNHDPLHAGGETVFGDQSIEFTLVVSTKSEERYTFDPTLQSQGLDDVTVIEGWPITGTVFQYQSTGEQTENYYSVTVTNQASSSSQTAFEVGEGDFLHVFLGNIQRGAVTAYFSENERAVASCPCPNGWEWFRSSSTDHTQEFHSCRMFAEQPVYTVYLAVRAASQEEFFNSVSYTLRASIAHITTEATVDWNGNHNFQNIPYLNWESIIVNRPTSASPDAYLEIHADYSAGSANAAVYINPDGHGTPDCFTAKCSLDDESDCWIFVPPCADSDQFYLTVAPDEVETETSDEQDLFINVSFNWKEPQPIEINEWESPNTFTLDGNLEWLTFMRVYEGDLQPALTSEDPIFIVVAGHGSSGNQNAEDTYYLNWNTLTSSVVWPRNQSPRDFGVRDLNAFGAAYCGVTSCEALASETVLEYGMCDVASGRLPNARPTLTVGTPLTSSAVGVTIVTDPDAGNVLNWPQIDGDQDRFDLSALRYRTVEIANIQDTDLDTDTFIDFAFTVEAEDDLDSSSLSVNNFEAWVYVDTQPHYGPAHCMPEANVLHYQPDVDGVNGDLCTVTGSSSFRTITCRIPPCCVEKGTYYLTVHNKQQPLDDDDLDSPHTGFEIVLGNIDVQSGTLGYRNPEVVVLLGRAGFQPVQLPANGVLPSDSWAFTDTDSFPADSTTAVVEFEFTNAADVGFSLGINGKSLPSDDDDGRPWGASDSCFDDFELFCEVDSSVDRCVIRVAPCDVGLKTFAGSHFVIASRNIDNEPQSIQYDVEVRQWDVATIDIDGAAAGLVLSAEVNANEYAGTNSDWNDHFVRFPFDRTGLTAGTGFRDIPGFRTDSENMLTVTVTVTDGVNSINDVQLDIGLSGQFFSSNGGCFTNDDSADDFDCFTQSGVRICEAPICSSSGCLEAGTYTATVRNTGSDAEIGVSVVAAVTGRLVRGVDIEPLPIGTPVNINDANGENLFYIELSRNALSGQLVPLDLERDTFILPSLHIHASGDSSCRVTFWPEWACEQQFSDSFFACSTDDDDDDGENECDIVVDPCLMTDYVRLSLPDGSEVDLTGSDSVIWYGRVENCDDLDVTAHIIYPTIQSAGDFDLAPGVAFSEIYRFGGDVNLADNVGRPSTEYHMYRFSLPDSAWDRDYAASFSINPSDCTEDDSEIRMWTSFTDFATPACHWDTDSGSSSFTLNTCEINGGYVYITVTSSRFYSGGYHDAVPGVYTLTASVEETVYEELPKECAYIIEEDGQRLLADFSGEVFGTEITFFVDVTESDEFWESRDGDEALQVWHPEFSSRECPDASDFAYTCEASIDEDIQESLGGGCARFLCSISIPVCEFATGQYLVEARYKGSFVWVTYDAKEIPVVPLSLDHTTAWFSGQLRQRANHFLGTHTWQFYQFVLEDANSRPRLRARVLDTGASIDVHYAWGGRFERDIFGGCSNVGEGGFDQWTGIDGTGCLDASGAVVTWPLDEYLQNSDDCDGCQSILNVAVRGNEAAQGCDTIHYEVELFAYPAYQPLAHCKETCGKLAVDEIDYYLLDLPSVDANWNYGSVTIEMLYWEPRDLFDSNVPEWEISFQSNPNSRESRCDDTWFTCDSDVCTFDFVDSPSCLSTDESAIISVRRVKETPTTRTNCDLAVQYSFKVCFDSVSSPTVFSFDVGDTACVDPYPLVDVPADNFEYPFDHIYIDVASQPGEWYQVLSKYDGARTRLVDGLDTDYGSSEKDDESDLFSYRECDACRFAEDSNTNEGTHVWETSARYTVAVGDGRFDSYRASTGIPIAVNLIANMEDAVDITETGIGFIDLTSSFEQKYFWGPEDVWYDIRLYKWQPSPETLRVGGLAVGFTAEIVSENDNNDSLELAWSLNGPPDEDCSAVGCERTHDYDFSLSETFAAYDGSVPIYFTVWIIGDQYYCEDAELHVTLDYIPLEPCWSEPLTLESAVTALPRQWASWAESTDWTTYYQRSHAGPALCDDTPCRNFYVFTLPQDMEEWDFVQFSLAQVDMHLGVSQAVSSFKVWSYAPFQSCDDSPWVQECDWDDHDQEEAFEGGYRGKRACDLELGLCAQYSTDVVLNADPDFWQPTDLFFAVGINVEDLDQQETQFTFRYKMLVDPYPWKELLGSGIAANEVKGNVLAAPGQFRHFWRASSAGGALVLRLTQRQGYHYLKVTVRDHWCGEADSCGVEVVRTCRQTECRFEFINEADHSGSDWWWITVETENSERDDSDVYLDETVYDIAAEAGLNGNCQLASAVFPISSNDFFCVAGRLPEGYLQQSPPVYVWTNGGADMVTRHAEAEYRYEQLVRNWCPSPSDECRQALAQFSCLESFRSCHGDLGFTQPLCGSICDDVVRACATCGDSSWENKQNLFGITDPRLEWVCGSNRYGDDPLSFDDPARCTGFVFANVGPSGNSTTTTPPPTPSSNVTATGTGSGTTTATTSATTTSTTTTGSSSSTTTGQINSSSTLTASLLFSLLLLALITFF